jgi:hypothetical protein
VRAVIVEPLNELAVLLCVLVRHGRIDDLGIELGVEIARRVVLGVGAESHPAELANANNLLGVLVPNLAYRLQRVRGIAAFDPHLLADGDAQSAERMCVGRAVLLVVQILLFLPGFRYMYCACGHDLPPKH